ncbi:flagellin [Acetobacterium carbinolicum]|uniref:flagellin N-terminal helical domain-containing protein n=1 Tax=Acetobacterium carbinolicum TaxID=52690 RepID=UPI0039C9189A
MRINHNITALNTYNKLTANNQATSKSLEKLSSGLKINKAGDNAAGLAISEKMRGQIRGLDQASANSSDAISLVNTAEGALNETHSILQRMRELAVQSSNDTNTDADRAEIQKEVQQLSDEIDRISATTQFNTKNLLDGSMGKKITATKNVYSNTSINGSGAAGSGVVAGSTLLGLKDTNGKNLGIVVGDTITVSYVKDGETTTSAGLTVATGSTFTNLASQVLATGAVAAYDTLSGGSGTSFTAGTAGFDSAIHGLTITVKDKDGVIKANATNALSSFTETTAAADARNTDGQATFHIGSNTNQSMQVSIENMSASALGVSSIDVDTQVNAEIAVKAVDEAITKVSAERSKLGAVQNRLDHTINNLGTSSENLTSAESRIRDVDMAAEMMEFTKNNILSQAAQSMLAQANQQPQGVLQLLQ